MSNYGLRVRSNIEGQRTAQAERALKLVNYVVAAERPIDLSARIQQQIQEKYKSKASFSEGITEDAAWQIFFDQRDRLENVATEMSNNGFIDPFHAVDPKNLVSDWAAEVVDQAGTEKERLLSLSKSILRLYDISKAKERKNKSFVFDEGEDDIVEIFSAPDKYLNEAERSLRYSFLMLRVARAVRFKCGISMDGKNAVSWIKINDKCREFDLQKIFLLQKMVTEAMVTKNKNFEFNFPVIEPNLTTARTIFSIWHQLRGESLAGQVNISDAETAFIKALEIDRDNPFCIDLLRELGKKTLPLVGYGDAETVIKDYSEDKMPIDKKERLERDVSDHRSIRMALSKAAEDVGLLEWGDV